MSSARHNDHRRLEQRSLALHRLVARKVIATPGLLTIARENLSRWRAAGDAASPALAEWDAILDGSIESIVALLVSRSERAIRLRQSSPFAGILTEAERKAIYESHAAGAHHPGRQPDLG